MQEGLNDAENELAKKYPISALKVNQAKNEANEYTKKIYGKEAFVDGTEANAYRHAMWNAIMTDKIGVEKAKMFAYAHEQIPYNPEDHMTMDYHNNELGRRIAVQYAGEGYDVFSEKIQEAIKNREVIIIWD
jgi:hypothetical protein